MNARDAFDEWLATEPAALHNLTIAEVYMAGWDRGRAHERELAQPSPGNWVEVAQPGDGGGRGGASAGRLPRPGPADDREPCEQGNGPRGCCNTRQLGPHARTCRLSAGARDAMGDHERMFRHDAEIQTGKD